MDWSKPNRGNKITKWLLFILVLLIILGGGFYYWNEFYRPVPEEPVPSPSVSVVPRASFSPTASATPIDWHIYRNETYGFQITFTDQWQGYVAQVRRAPDQYANAEITVWVPSSDAAAAHSNKPGYINPVTISVYTQGGWDDLQGQGGPVSSIVGRSGNYIVAYTQWQDCPLADVAVCSNLNQTWKNNVVPSFKAL